MGRRGAILIMYKIERGLRDFVIFSNLEDLMYELENTVEALTGTEPDTIKLEIHLIEMSQEEFDALPKNEDY